MPRRGTDVVQLPVPPKKKTKFVEEPPPSLEVSFYDDEALPPGIVFSDVQQKKWRIGKPIGRGSFGRIYLASDEVEKEVTKVNARYVVKIEPHTNGPLFVEVHCLVRVAQVDEIKSWRQSHRQKRLGMPVYIASGSFTDENTGVKYRFLVLPRYDIDLQKIIARTKVLDLKNVLVLAIQILDVLEYLHDQGYTHSDIKSSNLMLGFDAGKLNKVPVVKPTPSFQKETKEVAVLAGRHRRAKSAKGRTANYYDDEDFVINGIDDNSDDEDVANVKRKLRKILSDRDSRTMHRHHAFNLRQLSNAVNYEDLNSSVCSDQSYQKLLDDYGSKSFINPSEDFYEDSKDKLKVDNNLNEIYKEAILSQSNGHIYLLDYGLASKFLDPEGNHKDFGMDARKAHDGTLEYSSRDSHIGAHSRRSDLETLGYNLLDWLTGSLPWKTTEVLAEPDLVHALKKNFMSDIKSILRTCFKTEFYPQFMEKYLEYVTSLDFTDKPDYDYCRSLFKSELLKNGYTKDTCLNFSEPLMSPMNRKLCYSKRFGRKNSPSDFLARSGIKKAYERENVCSLENDLKLELLKQTLNSSSDGFRKPCTSRNFFISDTDLIARLKKSLMPYDVFGKKLSPKNLRSNKKNIKRRGVRKHRNSIGKFGNFMGSARQFTWAEILAGNPEDIIRKERNATKSDDDEEEDFDEETCKFRIRKLSDASENSDSNLHSPLLQIDYLESMNPTYAMKDVVTKFQNKVCGKNVKDAEENAEGLEGYTPAMVKVYRIKEKREAREKAELMKQQCLHSEPMIVLPRCTRSKKMTTQKLTRVNKKKNNSESSTDAELDKQIVKKYVRTTRQKICTDNKEETEKPTKRTNKQVSNQSDLDSEKVTKTTSRKTRQHVSSESEKEKSDTETEIIPKRKTRQKEKTRSVEKKNIDEASPKKECKINKKEVKIFERKPPSVRCKKSSPRVRSTVTVPSTRRNLRSSRRIPQ